MRFRWGLVKEAVAIPTRLLGAACCSCKGMIRANLVKYTAKPIFDNLIH